MKLYEYTNYEQEVLALLNITELNISNLEENHSTEF